MTKPELGQLDELLSIRDEDDTPLTEWEADFIASLDGRRDRQLTEKQAECFDRSVE